MIEVTPTAELRRDFARWAIGHNVRTKSSTSFNVPDTLFSRVPAALLVGAKIDGQTYEAPEVEVLEEVEVEAEQPEPEPEPEPEVVYVEQVAAGLSHAEAQADAWPELEPEPVVETKTKTKTKVIAPEDQPTTMTGTVVPF